MQNRMTSKTDLRNWVDTATSDWMERTEKDVADITGAIQGMDHPRWGSDWTEFLDSLPELGMLVGES